MAAGILQPFENPPKSPFRKGGLKYLVRIDLG